MLIEIVKQIVDIIFYVFEMSLFVLLNGMLIIMYVAWKSTMMPFQQNRVLYEHRLRMKYQIFTVNFNEKIEIKKIQ
jgi:hypothetical protein